MSGHADTPELVKLAGRAMLNDPDSVSGELVRAWKALLAENQRLRDALERIAAEWDGQLGTGQMLTDFVRDALAGEDG